MVSEYEHHQNTRIKFLDEVEMILSLRGWELDGSEDLQLETYIHEIYKVEEFGDKTAKPYLERVKKAAEESAHGRFESVYEFLNDINNIRLSAR